VVEHDVGMTQLRSALVPLLVVVLLAIVALAGCSDDGDGGDDAADGTTTTSAGEADTVGTGTDGATSDASGDDTVVPADQVGTPTRSARRSARRSPPTWWATPSASR
jgi:hypothetical protein